MKRILATVTALTVALVVTAQEHYNAWLRGTLSVPAGRGIKIDNEWQYRWQNGFEQEYFPDKKLMFAYRSWLHYQQSEALKISLSPFAYFSNYRIIQSKNDEAIRPVSELRFSVAAEWQHRLPGKFYLLNRTAAEYRVFDNDQPDITRLRNRLGIRYDFSSKLRSGLFEEFLFHVSGTTGARFFDHNRVGVNLEYQALPHVKLEVGYMRIVRLPCLKTGRLYENNLFLNLTYGLSR